MMISALIGVSPGHRIPAEGEQEHPHFRAEHHLSHGAGLHLPLGVLQSPQHPQHQAGGGLAPLQPRLPFLCHYRQCSPSGKTNFIMGHTVLIQYYGKGLYVYV